MTWNVLQSAKTAAASGTGVTNATQTATYGTNVSSGTKLIAYITASTGTAGATISSVQDAALNSMTQVGFLQNTTTSGITTAIYAMDTPAGDVGAKPAIKATFSGAGQTFGISMLVQEVSGLLAGNTSAMWDGTAATVYFTSGASSEAQPAYSSGAAGEFLVALCADNGGPQTVTQPATYTPDANWVTGNSFADCAPAYKSSSGGPESGTWSFGGTTTSTGFIVVAFNLTPPAAGGPMSSWPSRPGLSRIRHHHGVRRQQIWQVFPQVTSAAAGIAAGTGVSLGQDTDVSATFAAQVAPAAGLATGTGTAQQPQGEGTSPATGTGTAQQAIPSAAPAAGLATGTGTAQPPSEAQAQLATGTGTAQQPAVSTGSGSANAPAGIAAGTGTAQQVTPAVSAVAGPAAGTGTAPQVTPSAGPAAGQVSGTGTAWSLSEAQAQLASGTGTAWSPGEAQARLATGTGIIIPSVLAPAGLASGTGTAQPAAFQLALAGLASGTGTAQPASTNAPASPHHRIHGQSGVAYLSLRSGDAASPVAFLTGWEISYTRDPVDTTVITDVQHLYVTGMTSSAGSFTGFYDTATAQTYAAAVDGLPRTLYLYPSLASPGTFFSGQVLPDYSTGSGVAAAVALTVTWSSAGPVTRTG